MKKFLISVAIIVALMSPTQETKAMEAKTKAFLVMCAYGTVGGALLGFASMAFGTNSRAIAQGASLGLYAGIIFGGYVISSHRSAGASEDFDQDPYATPPIDNAYPPEGGSGFGAPPPPSGNDGGFFGSPNRVFEINNKFVNNFKALDEKRGNFHAPPVYLNLYHTTF